MRQVDGTLVLAPSDFVGHLACRHLTRLDRAIAERRFALELPPDPRLEALRERGRRHEEEWVERLRASGVSVVELRDTEDPEATAAAMRQGHGAIVQAPLAGGAVRGRADALLKAEAPSALGGYSYEPADAKLALATRAGTVLQLCAYAALLEPLQGLQPVTLHVVTPAGEERYRTADFLAYFRFVRRRLEAALAGEAPATYPDPVPHCEVCRFWAHCLGVRRRDDHLSLVAGLGTLHRRELERLGIATVAALGAAAGGLPGRPARGSEEVYRRLGEQARLQVAARDLPTPPWEPLPPAPGCGLARLPEPAPGDVFLDLEGDPYVPGGGLEYLFGWTWCEEGRPRHEWRRALDRAAERRAAEELFDFLAAHLERFAGAHVYSFGAYERSALARLVGRHGTRADALDRLLRGERLVDLHAVLRQGVRVGVERYGLKELEAVTGFARGTDLRAAARARLAVELALELEVPETVDDADLEAVRAYNEEDCRSAAALRDWLEARRAELVAAGSEIARPEPAAGDPSEAVAEREREIAEVERALLAGVGDADPPTGEDRARRFLAAMLGYFRREEKCAWWEHFRLRDLEPEALLDEREALAGLEFLGLVPPEGRQRIARHRYRFPPQECALAAGDRVMLPRGERDEGAEGSDAFGTVTALDLDAGTVEICPTGRTSELHPAAVFQNQAVPVGDLEGSLLDLGRRVAERGLAGDGPRRAARDLLLRRPPRLRSGPAGPLRREGEDLRAATLRLCRHLDGGVLAVQGPPGSGKTYLGARAIVALARDRRVGVTAVSHKVIDNLLEEVSRAAAEAGVALDLVHKDDEGTAAGVCYLQDNPEATAAIRPGAVVGGTAWFWARDENAERLDYLVVDEAGQMALAQVLAAARAARNLVLLGDPQQLEQPRKGAHPEATDVAALVHLLGAERATLGPEQGLFLDRTWRLHPDLCRFTSEAYYDGRLAPVDGLERQALLAAGRFSGSGLFLVEAEHQGNQASSEEEAEAVVAVVRELLAGAPRWVHRAHGERPLTADDVLVVAPYNAQVALLRRRLRPVGVCRVGTVDKFQGQEAAVVVYSCTSSSPEDAPRGMAFLYDPHRFNVATSRARCVTIVVASPRLFEPECRTPDEMRWANGLCRFRELATVVELASDAQPVSSSRTR